jgi:LysM repeat protein
MKWKNRIERTARHERLRLLIGAALALALAGCSLFARGTEQAPAPTDTARPDSQLVFPTTAAPAETGEPPTETPGAETAASATPAEITRGAEEGLDGTPAATACPPPPGWVQHVVRAGETLYYLATSTGQSVEAVMQANCLLSDLILEDQILYLPAIPPPRPEPPAPPAGEPQGPAPTTCPSPFSCPLADLPPFLLAAGSPADPDFKPCENAPAGAHFIDIDDDRQAVGEHFYFYLCGYPLPQEPLAAGTTITATILQPDGLEVSVAVQAEHPNRDLKMGGASAVINWPAIPEKPLGAYQLAVDAGDGIADTLNFWVEATKPPDEHPELGRILVVPVSGLPGTSFVVYFVNFDLGATLQVELYGENNPVVGQAHDMTGRYTFSVDILKPLDGVPGKGWGRYDLPSDPGDPRGGYVIVYNNKEVVAQFWIQ